MRTRSTASLISEILRDPSTLSNFPELSSEDIALVENLFDAQETNSYLVTHEVDSAANGLVVTGQTIKLAMDWGVRLYAPKHTNIINEPNNIRLKKDRLLISNFKDNSCSVTDMNFLLKQKIGKYNLTPNLSLGEYSNAVDINYNARTNTYWVVSKDDNIIHLYNGTTTAFINSLGDGTSGVPTLSSVKFSSPVSVDFGLSTTYILCQSGTVTGATNVGYLAVFDSNNNFISTPLYPGKNNGQGYVYQHEIYAPKAIYVVHTGGKDLLYILNGYDEVGVFDSTDYSLLDYFSIPPELASTNLGLTNLTVDEKNLYLTAQNAGKVIAIDLKTKELVGVFGVLSDESSLMSQKTLGLFNGISGIVSYQDKLIITEKINNRVQVIGKNLFKPDSLFVTYKPIIIPQNKKLKAITANLNNNIGEKVLIIDKDTKQEISINFAKDKNLRYLQVKFILNPWTFSLEKQSIDLLPIYILLE